MNMARTERGGRWKSIWGVLVITVATACASLASTSPPQVSVLNVEAADSQLGYTAMLSDSGSKPSEDVMGQLRLGFVEGARLAILAGPDVPIRALATIRSMARKVGFISGGVKVFTFDKNKRGMIEVVIAKDFVTYESDGAALTKYFD
jgi:hypothetical protein